MSARKNSKHAAKTFCPAVWQWKPESVTAAHVQFWTASGTMTLVTMTEARKLVEARAAFAGSTNHVCQVHDRIDGSNAAVA